MQKPVYNVGDVLELEMMRPEGDRRFPISKTEYGLICLMRTKEGAKKPYYEYGSIWKCSVAEVFPNKLIVEPIELVFSAEENAAIADSKLKAAFGTEKQPRKKEIRSYPYKASYEK